MNSVTIEHLEDAALVRRAKAGELEAFEALTSRYERKVFALARRIVQQIQDAEDVTQQTFLSVLENLDGFRGEASFATWIWRIATHAALKILRKRKGLDTGLLGRSHGAGRGLCERPAPGVHCRLARVAGAIGPAEGNAKAPGRSAGPVGGKVPLVFLLRDVEGLSVKETADALNLSEANVKVRLLRARLQLREHLTGILGDERTRVSRPPAH